MRKAGLAALLLGAALCIPGCGFEEGAGATLRADASTDAALVASVANGTQLTSTGVCDNGWVEVSYEGQTAYVSGDYVSAVAADAGAADGAADVGADQAVDASTEG